MPTNMNPPIAKVAKPTMAAAFFVLGLMAFVKRRL
jgi:hypothetical protein